MIFHFYYLALSYSFNSISLPGIDGESKPEDFLRQRFQKTGQSTQAFSALEYVGINTRSHPTNFKVLKSCLHKHLNNSTVRSSRNPSVIFTVLKVVMFDKTSQLLFNYWYNLITAFERKV